MKTKSTLFTLFLTLMFFPTLLLAYHRENKWEMTFGVRRDQFWEYYDDHNEFTSTKKTVHAFSGTDNGMLITEVALKGSMWLYRALFLRLDVDYGWVTSGSLNFRNTSGFLVHSASPREISYVADESAMLGWLFCANSCTQITPLAGYTYNVQIIRTRGTQFGTSPTSNRKVNNYWIGPFVGVEIDYAYHPLLHFTGGYEVHKPSHIENLTVESATPTNINFHTNGGWGQTFRLSGLYQMTPCWRVGLQLGYQVFMASGGKVTPEAQPHLYSHARYIHASWRTGRILVVADTHF